MPHPEFSERQYEYCANHQLVAAFGAYLVGGMPSIPSQVDEALGGYDAAYEFSGGRILLLQFKVAHWSPRAHGRGAATYKLWAGPYYRTPLHQDGSGRYTQHNTLIDQISASCAALYVSPCFSTNADLRTRFANGMGTGVLDASLLAPLSGVGKILDTDHHSLSYPEDGRAFRIHSEPSEEHSAAQSMAAVLAQVESAVWGERYFDALRDRLRSALVEQDVRPVELPDEETFDSALAEISAILEQRVGAVMALVPDTDSGSDLAKP